MLAGGASSLAWLVRCRPALPARPERVDELLRRVGGLLAVHAEPDQGLAALRQQILDHGGGVGRGVGSVHVGDEADPHAEVGEGAVDAGRHPVEHRGRARPAARVQARVEEHLPVAQVAGAHAVLDGLVDAAGVVVGVTHDRRHEGEHLEELVAALVVVTSSGDARRQWHPVLAGQLDDGGGADRPLEVAVQLDLRDSPQVCGEVHGSASRVLDEVVGPQLEGSAPAYQLPRTWRRRASRRWPRRGVPQVAVVEEDVTGLGVEGDLAGHLVEAERHGDRRGGSPPAPRRRSLGDDRPVDVLVRGRRGPQVGTGHDPQEPVGRAGAVQVDRDRRGRPHGDVGARSASRCASRSCCSCSHCPDGRPGRRNRSARIPPTSTRRRAAADHIADRRASGPATRPWARGR